MTRSWPTLTTVRTLRWFCHRTASSSTSFRWRNLDKTSPLEYGMEFSREGIGICDVRRERKLLVRHAKLGLTLMTKLMLAEAGAKHPFRLSVDFGVNSLREGPDHPTNGGILPFQFRSMVAPTFIVGLAREGSGQWEGNVLTLPTYSGWVRVNGQTGEFVGFTSTDGNTDISAVRGALQARQKQLREVTAGHHDDYDANTPVSSVASFVCTSSLLRSALHEMYELSSEEQAALERHFRTANLLIDAGLLAPLDKAATSAPVPKNKADGFFIPSSQKNLDTTTEWAHLSIGLADYLFARNSWPWTVWREAGFAIAGHPGHWNHEMRRLLDSPDVGPLGHWALAELFARGQGDAWAAAHAQRGLRELNRNHFRQDMEAVLGQVLPHLVSVTHWLRQLDEPGRQQLATSLSVDADTIEQVVAAIRESTDAQAPAVLLDALDRLWVERWRVIAKRRMEKIFADDATRAAQARRNAMQ